MNRFNMQGEGISLFHQLAVDLADHEATLPRDFYSSGLKRLGVGREVVMDGVPVGVYARGSLSERLYRGAPDQIVIDFIANGSTLADSKASYHIRPDQVTVNSNETTGPNIVSLARLIGGLSLSRQPAERDIEVVPSLEELEFVDEFVRDPSNSTAMFAFTGMPGGLVTGLRIETLDTPLA